MRIAHTVRGVIPCGCLRTRRRPRTYLILLTVSFASAVVNCWGQSMRFDIERGLLRRSLMQFNSQADPWRVIYDDRRVGSVETNAVHGQMTPAEALIQLLKPTEFGCKFRSNMQLVVTPRAPWRAPLDHCDPDSSSLAQVSVTSPGQSDASLAEKLEEVLVPGTRHRGIEETGGLTIMLDETSPVWLGATTVPQILRRLPQDYRGGPNEDTHWVGAETPTNSGLGVAANLRALGARATLVLLDGQRVAPSGDQAAFTDLLNMPLSAVEGIGVAMDGASALYGSDAVGGVINITTRDRFSGGRTFADVGGNVDGTQHQYRLGHIEGLDWGSGHGVIALEAYGRDALPAAQRALATSDLRPWGPNLDTSYSNPGTLIMGANTYAIPPGLRSVDLSTLQPGTQNSSDEYADADILPRQRRESVYASIRQAFNDEVEGFARGLWSERRASQHEGGDRVLIDVPSDSSLLTHVPPDAGPVGLEYNLENVLGSRVSEVTVRTVNLTSGLQIDLSHGWRVTTSIGDSVEQQTQSGGGFARRGVFQSAVGDPDSPTPFNPFDGSAATPELIAALQRQPWFGMRSELWQIHADVGGLLGYLPGGDVRVAFGAEYRNQLFKTGTSAAVEKPVIGSDRGRRLQAAYTELLVPVVGAENAFTGVQKLDVSAAARYENYSDFGSTLTPRFWLVYSPLQGIQIRSSYGRSTRAPNLGDLDESHNVSFLQMLSDHLAPGGNSQILAWSGSNAGLKAERATSHTVGVHFEPVGMPGFQADVNYFNIVFRDRIQATGADSDGNILPQVLNDPQYQDIVDRHPTAELRDRICRTTYSTDSLDDCLHSPISALVDLRTLNIATLLTQGLDFIARFKEETSLGDLSYTLSGVYLLNYAQKSTPHTPAQSALNTLNNPLNFRVLTTVGWSWRGFGAQLIGNYSNGYHDPANAARPNIPSWLTADVGLQYQFGDASGTGMNGLLVGLNVENLFNHGPPSVVNRASRIGYDEENAELSGRIIRFRIAKQW
jgi:iron complex outermembrane receptor protein